jgi:hypothetical protein
MKTTILEQVTTMKYLGIIIDYKFKFKEHITYVAAERCMKLISQLIQIGQINMGNQT